MLVPPSSAPPRPPLSVIAGLRLPSSRQDLCLHRGAPGPRRLRAAPRLGGGAAGWAGAGGGQKTGCPPSPSTPGGVRVTALESAGPASLSVALACPLTGARRSAQARPALGPSWAPALLVAQDRPLGGGVAPSAQPPQPPSLSLSARPPPRPPHGPAPRPPPRSFSLFSSSVCPSPLTGFWVCNF